MSKGSSSLKLSFFQYSMLKFAGNFNHLYTPCCGMNSAEHCDSQLWMAILGSCRIVFTELRFGCIRSVPTTLASIEAKIAYEKDGKLLKAFSPCRYWISRSLKFARTLHFLHWEPQIFKKSFYTNSNKKGTCFGLYYANTVVGTRHTSLDISFMRIPGDTFLWFVF